MIRATVIATFAATAITAGLLAIFAAMGNEAPASAGEMGNADDARNVTVIYKTPGPFFTAAQKLPACVIGQCQDI